MKKLFEELKRRNVIKAAIAYLVVSWLLLQVFSIVLPAINAPAWVLQTFMLVLAIGFPIWLFFSWVYEMTPEGIKKTAEIEEDLSITAKTNKRLNILILFLLIIVIAMLWLKPSTNLMEPKDGKHAIAVLPFEDLSAKGDGNWFCIGVTEDILTHLSKIKDLRVISRTSVMQYKSHEKSIPEIAEELGVSYVVEGSVRKQGDKVLVTAQLINANDNHLWADNFNENLDDVFKIQQEISKKIVQQLKIVISPEEEALLESSSTTNVEAYQLFLRGRVLADTRTEDNLKKSIEYYERAIALDSNYADAYAEMANSIYLFVHQGNDMSTDEIISESKEYVNKALEINSNTVRAYTVFGTISVYEQKWDLAKENFEKAISINPNDATAHHHYALYYRNKPTKDWKNYLIQINEAHKLDPLSMPINITKILALIANGKIDEAEEHLNKFSYMLNSHTILLRRAQISALKSKDITEFIKVFLAAIEKAPENARLHNDLSNYYRSILNDFGSAVKHAKIAHELDGTYTMNYLINLCYNKQYEEAKNMLEDSSLMSSFSESEKQYYWFLYFTLKGEYKKAMHYIDNYLPDHLDDKIWLLSLMGEKGIVLKMLKSKGGPASISSKLHIYKARIFANLKLRDSMYYYIDKTLKRDAKSFHMYSIMSLNGRFEFDPYRNEPRYKAYLKENYFPVTHWNE